MNARYSILALVWITAALSAATVSAAAVGAAILTAAPLGAVTTSAATSHPNDPAGVPQDSLESRLTLLPIIFSSPDTGYAFGVLPQYVFYTSPGTRPSNVRADLYYTQKGQFNFQFTPEFWLPGDKSSIRGRLQFRDWPTSFYGAAPPAFESSESFDEKLVVASLEFQRRVRSGLYVGLSYRIRWGSVSPDSAATILSSGSITGDSRGYTSGIGVVASYDTRNHVYLPTRGSLVKLSAEGYSRFLGSDYSFVALTADARQYLSISANQSVAVQMVVSSIVGDAPFRLLPGIGSVLRGYGSTRHIAHNRWAAQIEYRAIPVFWRLGGVVFAGIGDTSKRLEDFDTDLQYTLGFGVRFLIFESLKITIRQDFGFGRNSSGDYLDLNEAF